jgi:hypothetical protein
MTTSPADLALLRTQPHFEQMFLSIYQPTTLWSATVNDAGIVQGAMDITYSFIAGNSADVFANSVLLVGTTAGASDVGRVRIRSIDGTQIHVAWNTDIPWKNGLYLTAINYVDLNPIYPRVVNTGTQPTDSTFYKDYDVVYTNQNSVLGAFPCAGPHQAVFMKNGADAEIYWTASGSYHVKGDALTYEWEFEGGNPATYSGITPGIVTYATPGHYKTKLTVSGSVSVDVTYRFVSVYARNGANAIPPIQKWSMSKLDGSRSEGGYSVNFKIYDQVSNIYDGALVILFPDQTTYGTTKTVVGSPLKFVGYIQRGTIVYDYENSCIEFTAISASEMLKNIEGFSISCESVAAPTYWGEIENMTLMRAVYHYLRWHTTVLDCTDVQYTGDDRLRQYFDSNRESIYDAINNFISRGIIGEIVCNRQGKIWIEISAGAVHDAQTAVPLCMILTNEDWMGEPSIEERTTKEYSVLELGGTIFDGTSSTAVLSLAPGFSPSVRGKINRIEGFIANSQVQMNEVNGDYYAYITAKYAMSLKMAGNYNNIDIAPIQQCQMNVSGTNTVRGLNWSNKPFHPVQMDWSYDAQHGSTYPIIKFAELTNGLAGVTTAVATASTVDIPPVAPIDVPNIPPIVIPPFPFPNFWGGKTYTWVVSNPTIGGIPGPRLSQLQNAVRLDYFVVGGVRTPTLTFNIEDRPLNINPGTNLTTADSIALQGAVANLAISHPLLPVGDWLWLDIAGVTGSPTYFVVTLTTEPL